MTHELTMKNGEEEDDTRTGALKAFTKDESDDEEEESKDDEEFAMITSSRGSFLAKKKDFCKRPERGSHQEPRKKKIETCENHKTKEKEKRSKRQEKAKLVNASKVKLTDFPSL
ncbi:hypothetical protein Pint_02686 [Pistacia integerrima]|uniref:Uncharacterized protein n=1 Tax=Pistacia integerrima TaxID=434235 RepID=A0ACC0ZKK8_9ROSI|nr:hypothetical protein Pint_02686 [Pistacia integerrima]